MTFEVIFAVLDRSILWVLLFENYKFLLIRSNYHAETWSLVGNRWDNLKITELWEVHYGEEILGFICVLNRLDYVAKICRVSSWFNLIFSFRLIAWCYFLWEFTFDQLVHDDGSHVMIYLFVFEIGISYSITSDNVWFLVLRVYLCE